MAVTVVVVLAVGLVVFLVAAHEVVQREAIVRDEEVDAGVGAAPVVLEKIAGTREPRGQLAHLRVVAFPVGPHTVAILAIPLGPTHREVPHLITSLAHVPRLGDELHALEHRVLMDDIEEAPELVHLVQFAGEGRGEIEAEPIHAALGGKVAQRIHHELEHAWVLHIERIASARVIHVVTRRPRDEPVVALVVDPFETKRGAEMIAFRRVIIDHVHDDLEPRRVQALHHLLELRHLRPRHPRRRVT